MSEKFSEKKYVNRVALLGHTVIGAILFLAYALEFLKGSRTIGYFTLFSLICLIPIVVEHILYRRNPEDGKIQHIMGVCYGFL